VPKLSIDPGILTIEQEVASAICARDADGAILDPDIAKHFTVVIRKQYLPAESEAVIICAALLETGHSGLSAGIPVVQHILGLDSQEKRLVFFREYVFFLSFAFWHPLTNNDWLFTLPGQKKNKRYSRLLVAAVVPPLLHNGVAFEAHPQNTHLRLSRSALTPTGFVLRDLGGLRVHPATLAASTTTTTSGPGSGPGSEFAFLPGHCVVTSTREDAANKLYHTLVHNHLQRLARVLRLHGYDGDHGNDAWSVVREHLTREIPRGSWLWSAWMDEAVRSVSGKCLVRMKLEGVYREVSWTLFLPQVPHLSPRACFASF
jgi:hypothetical protein